MMDQNRVPQPKPRVFIAAPCFGQMMNAQTATSLVALVQRLTIEGIPVGISALSFPDISELRNVYATIFYDSLDASHLLFVDADVQFEPELVMDMLAADKPLTGAIYPTKKLPISWVGSALDPPAQPDGNLLELEGLGCGVMLIRRDCIENIIATGNVEIEDDPLGAAAEIVRAKGATRMIRAFDLVKDGKRRLSEDFSFCHRHRKAGGKVWAVINHTLAHLGIYQFVGKYSSHNEAQRLASRGGAQSAA